MERLKLGEIGLKHIDTFDKLVAFCEGFCKFLLSKNPHPRYDAIKYRAYSRQCRRMAGQSITHQWQAQSDPTLSDA